jgi:uncharacterized membrane protein
MSHQEAAAAVAGLLIFAATVWVGGSVVIALVARVATRTLTPEARVAFFRGLGRAYGVLGTAALAVAYGAGAALVYGRPWNATLTATAVVATALVAATAVGVVQARRMSRLRRRALDEPGGTQLAGRVHRGAVRAGALRGAIGGLSLALLALAVLVGS